MTPEVFDRRICQLGEGALWHPARNQLFWFDIKDRRMLSRAEDRPLDWAFEHHVSAAGWIGRDDLLIASETALFRFTLSTGAREEICPLEAGSPGTRSNDGRADPWGGFWIGTMGFHAEPGAGAIYRLYRGELRTIATGLAVPNAICFAPFAPCAFFTDTPTRQVMRLPLHPDTGWPEAPPARAFALADRQGYPDGAITDAEGQLWIAEWDGARISRHDPKTGRSSGLALPARRPTCPAFGGPRLRDLFVTTAATGLRETAGQGLTYVFRDAGQGRAEPRVIL